MQRSISSSFNTVKSPWRATLVEAARNVQNKVFCVSPFFTDDVVTSLERAFLSQENAEPQSLVIHVLTRIRQEDFLTGASQLEALEHVLSWTTRFPNWQVELRAEDRIHAKVWIIDSNKGFIGSGNATRSGLDRNIEYGVAVADTEFIRIMRNDWYSVWNHSQLVTLSDLQNMRMLLEEETNPQIQELERRLAQIRKEVALKRKLPTRLGTNNIFSTTINKDQLENVVKGTSSLSNDNKEVLAQQTLESMLEEDKQAEGLQVDTVEDLDYLPMNTIQVRTSELLQALCWISPLIETQDILNTPPTGFTHNELIWSPQQNVLQCYADREFRRSRAIVEVLGHSDTVNWNITLNASTLKELQASLLVHQEKPHPHVLLFLDSRKQELLVSQLQGNKETVASYKVHITHPTLKWGAWHQSAYRLTTRHITLLKSLKELVNMELEEALADNASILDLAHNNYGLHCILSPGQKEFIGQSSLIYHRFQKEQTTVSLKEPVLKIKRKSARLETMLETVVPGNGRKYLEYYPPMQRYISFNDLVLALRGAPEHLHHWRILLDIDSLTEFDGITNRPIVGLQPETPPTYLENAPKLLRHWWHMLYHYWE